MFRIVHPPDPPESRSGSADQRQRRHLLVRVAPASCRQLLSAPTGQLPTPRAPRSALACITPDKKRERLSGRRPPSFALRLLVDVVFRFQALDGLFDEGFYLLGS